MTNQVYQYAGGYGTIAIPNAPIVSPRDPVTGTDVVSPDGNAYQIGQYWRNSNNADLWVYSGQAWELLASASGTPVLELSADSGIALPAAGIIDIAGGTGITTSATGNTVTITAAGSFLPYTTVTTSTAMAVNNGYITNSGGLLTMTLPTTAAVGNQIEVVGRGTGGWLIAQGVGQIIHMNSVSTTSGLGGSLASSAQFNAVQLVCTVANTDFTVISSEGTLTVT